MKSETTTDRPLNTAEAADYLGLSVETLNKWRGKGRGPTFIRMGTAVRYRREDLERFIEANTVKAGGEK